MNQDIPNIKNFLRQKATLDARIGRIFPYLSYEQIISLHDFISHLISECDDFDMERAPLDYASLYKKSHEMVRKALIGE